MSVVTEQAELRTRTWIKFWTHGLVCGALLAMIAIAAYDHLHTGSNAVSQPAVEQRASSGDTGTAPKADQSTDAGSGLVLPETDEETRYRTVPPTPATSTQSQDSSTAGSGLVPPPIDEFRNHGQQPVQQSADDRRGPERDR
jgi:hypothetical protein